MPFRTFNTWLFDGNLQTPVPSSLLKYNSPISPIYAIRLFLLYGDLNHYLDKYINNIGLMYLDKEELFQFLKQCVHNFRVRKTHLAFFKYKKTEELFNILKRKNPLLKDYDVQLLCDIINKSEEKESIFTALGLEEVKKQKVSQKNKQKNKVSLKEYLATAYKVISVKEKN